MLASLIRVLNHIFTPTYNKRRRQPQRTFAADVQLLELRTLMSGHAVAFFSTPTSSGPNESKSQAAPLILMPNVVSAPVVTTNPISQTVKAGAAVSLTAAATGTPAPTVQWQVSTNGGVSFAKIPGAALKTYSFTAVAGQNGNEFRAVFTNSQGSVSTAAATLTVLAIPAVTTNPTSQSIKSGASVTFTAAASGNPAASVQWQVSANGGATFTNIAGATSTTDSFTVAASQNGYKYRAVFTNSQGTATTAAATLTVLTIPTVTTNPASQSIKSGLAVTFTSAAIGNPTPTAQWQVSTNGGVTFTNIVGAVSTNYSFFVTPSQNGYKYRALFANSQGDLPTTAATLTVLTIPAVTGNPTSQSIASGSAVTFSAAASGNPDATVQWQVSINGGVTFTNIAGATSTAYSFTAASTENGDKYRAVFTNAEGSATTAAATLTVLSIPTVTTNPVSQSIKSGLGVTFTAAATGNPLPTVQWQVSSNGGTTFTNIVGAVSTTYSFTVTAGESGNKYRALFTNAEGDLPTTAATLTVLSLPAVTTNPANQSIKSGSVATFVAAATGNPAPTVQWQVSTNGGTTYSNIPGATSTTYSFTVAAGESGYKYRAVFANSLGTATTTAASLTIPPVNTLLHNFGDLGVGGVLYQLGTGPNGSEIFELDHSAASNDVQLWSSDGTVAGTVLLHDFGNLGQAGRLDALQQLGTGASASLVFMSVDFATAQTQLWGTNGTTAGTVLLHNFGNLGTGGVLEAFDVVGTGANSYALLESLNSTTNDTQLWGTNATVAGTALLHDFGNLQATGGIAVEGTGSNGSVLFDSNNSTTQDTQLWASNGLASGTILLHDFGALGNNVTFLSGISTAENGSLLLQSANLATGDNQLWASSGTVAGTMLLHDYGDLAAANSGSTGSLSLIGRVSNGIILLEAYNTVTGETQLWATDGTVPGTILIQDLGERGLNNDLLLGIGNAPDGSVLFSALDPVSEVFRLWKSNGTLAGTVGLHSFGNLGTAGFVGGLETASNGTRMFTVYNSTTDDTQLWTSDGTVTGTIGLKDLGELGTNELDIDAVNLLGTDANVSGLFQTYNSATGDVQLWDSQGTVASTVMLHDFGGAPLGGILADLNANLSGVELLQWSDPTTGNLDLWVSNGTVSGTVLLHDFPSVGLGSIFYLSTSSTGNALLQMNDPSTADSQLWASDGTVAGTNLLHDFGFESLSTVIDEQTGANVPGLVVALNTSTNDVQLWKSDGTVAGTSMVIDSGTTYNTFTFTQDGGALFDISTVTSTDDTELLLITP